MYSLDNLLEERYYYNVRRRYQSRKWTTGLLLACAAGAIVVALVPAGYLLTEQVITNGLVIVGVAIISALLFFVSVGVVNFWIYYRRVRRFRESRYRAMVDIHMRDSFRDLVNKMSPEVAVFSADDPFEPTIDFLRAWNKFEVRATLTLRNTHPECEAISPGAVVQALEKYNLLEQEEIGRLRELFELRNSVAHGTVRDVDPTANEFLEHVKNRLSAHDGNDRSAPGEADS